MKTPLLVALLLALGTGCSTLPRHRSVEVADDELLGDLGGDLGPMQPTATQGPDRMDVAWEDNGIPIRATAGPGRPRSMEVPNSKLVKRGVPVSTK